MTFELSFFFFIFYFFCFSCSSAASSSFSSSGFSLNSFESEESSSYFDIGRSFEIFTFITVTSACILQPLTQLHDIFLIFPVSTPNAYYHILCLTNFATANILLNYVVSQLLQLGEDFPIEMTIENLIF